MTELKTHTVLQKFIRENRRPKPLPQPLEDIQGPPDKITTIEYYLIANAKRNFLV